MGAQTGVVDVGDSGPIQKEIPRFIITHTVRIRGNGGTTVNPITVSVR